MKAIVLGDEVKDIVTGFTGIAVGRTVWLNKCSRVAIQPQSLYEGKPIEAQWFDEQQLEVTKAQAVVIAKVDETGGPRPVETSRRADPQR